MSEFDKWAAKKYPNASRKDSLGAFSRDLMKSAREGWDAHAELAALKAGQGEAVAWRYTSSQSFGRSDRKWHYQESFPHAGNRAVLEIGKLEALYLDPPASADAVSVPRELLKELIDAAEYGTGINNHELIQARALLAQSESKGVEP